MKIAITDTNYVGLSNAILLAQRKEVVTITTLSLAMGSYCLLKILKILRADYQYVPHKLKLTIFEAIATSIEFNSKYSSAQF